MRFFGFEIVRLKGMPVGGVRELNPALVDLQTRVNRLEHHRKSVAVKTEKELSDEEEIQAILRGDQVPDRRLPAETDFASGYHRR